MNVAIRTLKLVDDVRRGDDEFLAALDWMAVVDAAGHQTAAELGVDTGERDPELLCDRLRAALTDDQYVDRLAELADTSLVVSQEVVVADVLERQADGELEPTLPDDGWNAVATEFIRALMGELVSTDGETDQSTLTDLGVTALHRGAVETAETYLELSRELAREVDDRAAEAASLTQLGNGALKSGNLETAEEYHQQSLDIAREIGDRATEADSLAGLGTVAFQRDELATAEEYHQESLDITREIDERSTEADCLGALGSIATIRGEFDTAEAYLGESLDIKRLIDDEQGEATALASLGNLAADREDYETATQRYTEAVAIFEALDHPSEHAQTLQNLVMAEMELGDTDAAIDHCEDGLELLAGTDQSLDEVEHWFRTTHVRLTADPAAVDSLYREALGYIREDDDPAAFERLGSLWDCRDAFEPGTEPHGRCLRAGVAFAAFHLLLEPDTVDSTHTSIISEIESHREALSEPATTLFEFAADDGVDRDVEISTEGLDEDDSLDDFERGVYAEFLSRINETPPPAELYSEALTHIVNGDRNPADVVQLCLVAWNQYDDAGDDASAIRNAILLAEAHRELFDFDLPTEKGEIFDLIGSHRSTLSEPMAALFDQLATGSTDTDPQALVDAADDEEPSLADVERMAVARFLAQLQR